MQFAIDLHALSDAPYTGKHYFTRDLTQAMLALPESREHTWHLLASCDDVLELDDQSHMFWHLTPRSKRYQMIRKLPSIHPNIQLVSPTSYLVTTLSPVPVTTWVYDLAVFRSDVSKPDLKAQVLERSLLWYVTRKSNRLLVMREGMQDELAARYGDGIRSKAATVPGIVRPLSTTDAQLPAIVPDQYILYVGTIEPRKRVEDLITSYVLARQSDDLPPLVLAGKLGWETERVMQLVTDNSETVIYLGYVADEQLVALYKQSLFVVYPSVYEGFGLPVVEALSHGKACVVSDNPDMKQLVGKAGVGVNPQDHERFGQILARLMDEAYREELEAHAKKQAALYSLDRTARQYLSALTQSTI